ncbi:MAG: hypothetical protein ACOY3P_21250 [Planctomycetota bacterium]
MTVKNRERILALVAGCMLLGLVSVFVLSGGSGMSMEALKNRREALSAEIAKHQAKVRGSASAARKMQEWEKRSLPTKPDAARTGYQNWLGGVIEKHRFRDPSINSGIGQRLRGKQGDIYTVYPFSVDARGSLEQLVEFLHDFYSAGHLHHIKQIGITPPTNPKQRDLQFSFSIEAMALPTADRDSDLTKLPGEQLKRDKLEEYRAVLLRRQMESDRFADTAGLFAGYQPPARPEPPRIERPRPPEFDHAKFALVVGITEVAGASEVWIHVQTTGQNFKLSEGEPFQIGSTKGKVLKISGRDVELEFGGKRLLVPTGASLREGLELKS